jgi:hypothetical protein
LALPGQIEQLWQNNLSQFTPCGAIALVLAILYAIWVFWPSILAVLQPAGWRANGEDRSINATGATITRSVLNTGIINLAAPEPQFSAGELFQRAAAPVGWPSYSPARS